MTTIVTNPDIALSPEVNRRERNVIIGSITGEELDAFFGPIKDDDVFILFPDDARFPEIMVAFGIFKSKTQARKNGWDKDIPEGFWMKEKVGKLNQSIAILKRTK